MFSGCLRFAFRTSCILEGFLQAVNFFLFVFFWKVFRQVNFLFFAGGFQAVKSTFCFCWNIRCFQAYIINFALLKVFQPLARRKSSKEAPPAGACFIFCTFYCELRHEHLPIYRNTSVPFRCSFFPAGLSGIRHSLGLPIGVLQGNVQTSVRPHFLTKTKKRYTDGFSASWRYREWSQPFKAQQNRLGDTVLYHSPGIPLLGAFSLGPCAITPATSGRGAFVCSTHMYLVSRVIHTWGVRRCTGALFSYENSA